MSAKQNITCAECKKENCPQRVIGAVCSINSNLSALVSASKTRDPLMLSSFIVSMVGEEYERYQKAKSMESIGEKKIKQVVTKGGEVVDIEVENPVDNNVSTLAMNIIKSGKILNDILNPPKAAPFSQTNIQNNFGVQAADEIRNLGGKAREEVLKYIDGKLDAKRTS